MIGGKLVDGGAGAAWPGRGRRERGGTGRGRPLPERRITVEPGVDFYGSDLRSIYGTTLPICRDACLAEGACTAFTFNTAANACFLKSDDGARTAFPTALSATLAPAARRARGPGGRACRRARLPPGRRGSPRRARRRSRRASAGQPRSPSPRSRPSSTRCWPRSTGPTPPPPGRRSPPSPPAAAVEDWEPARRRCATSRSRRGSTPIFAPDRRRGRRGRPPHRRRARGRGRGPRLARRAPPRRAARARARRSRRRWRGPRASTASASSTARSTSRRRARAPASTFSEPLAGAGVDYADFVRVDAGTFPVEARDRQLCIDGLAHGSRYQVTLRAGLPSAAGERLRASVGAGGLRPRPHAGGALRRPRLCAAEERRGGAPDRLGQCRRGRAAALPRRHAQRRARCSATATSAAR